MLNEGRPDSSTATTSPSMTVSSGNDASALTMAGYLELKSLSFPDRSCTDHWLSRRVRDTHRASVRKSTRRLPATPRFEVAQHRLDEPGFRLRHRFHVRIDTRNFQRHGHILAARRWDRCASEALQIGCTFALSKASKRVCQTPTGHVFLFSIWRPFKWAARSRKHSEIRWTWHSTRNIGD